jgi:hypothetical protein
MWDLFMENKNKKIVVNQTWCQNVTLWNHLLKVAFGNPYFGNLWAFLRILDWYHYLSQKCLWFVLTQAKINICRFSISFSNFGFILQWIWILCKNSRSNEGSHIGSCLWKAIVCSLWTTAIALLFKVSN